MPFSERLAAAACTVERHLAEILDGPACAAAPRRLRLAMRHAVLAGGKRLRPFLVIETARLFDVPAAAALDAAAALECVHCYSLAHDDLPAMDNDELRRGQPTVWKAFDEWTAILAGDALLTLAFEILARPSPHTSPEVRGELVLALARAAGPAGMAGGQCLDLEAEKLARPRLDLPAGSSLPSVPQPDMREGRQSSDSPSPRLRGEGIKAVRTSIDALAHVRRLQAMKTGALITFACEAGAILGGADPASRAALGSFGQNLGFAFQVADDLLDAEGDAGTVGKATGKDAGAGKATLVSLLGVAAARARLAEVEAAAVAALAPFGARAATLSEAARFVARRER